MSKLINFCSSPFEQKQLLDGSRSIILRICLEKKVNIVNTEDVIFFDSNSKHYIVTKKVICNSFEEALSSCNTDKLFPGKKTETIIKEFRSKYPKKHKSSWKFILFELEETKSMKGKNSIQSFTYKPLDI